MACHSEVIGRQFQKQCANHVICVNQGKAVLDKASIEFTINLYKLLLGGDTVCNAFRRAIANTKSVLGHKKEHESEEGKIFKLLCKPDHVCTGIFNDMPEKGKFKCLADHSLLKIVPSLHNVLEPEYRIDERLETMMALSNHERLIQLSYLYGDSKETIAKSCLKFVVERKIFNGGVLYYDLKEKTCCQEFFTTMREDLSDKLGWSTDKMSGFSTAPAQLDFVKFLEKFFTQRGEYKIPNHQNKHLKNERKLEFLLVLENIEKIVEYDNEFFIKSFLLQLVKNCDSLTIMFSSCEWVEAFYNDYPLRVIPIMELDRIQSVKLFLQSAGKREVKATEV